MHSHVKGRPHKERVAETKADYRNGLISELPDSEITLIKNEVIAHLLASLSKILLEHLNLNMRWILEPLNR